MDVGNAVCTASYTMFMVTQCRSECCVLSGLDFEAAGGSVARTIIIRILRTLCMLKIIMFQLYIN